MRLASDRSHHRRSRGRPRPGANDWLDPEDQRQRALRRWLVRSAIGHVVVLGVLVWSPAPATPRLPDVVTVDLVAMASSVQSGPARALASAPAPARAAIPEPVPPQPPPAPPAPEATVPPPREPALPKAPARAEPKQPKQRAKPDPAPKPPPAKPAAKASPPKAPPPRREHAYDDVLAELRAERGEARPTRADREGVQTASAAGVSGGGGTTGAAARGAGERIDAELAVWLRAAKYHVEQAWIMPSGFERERLRTVVRVQIDAGGRVLGAPRIEQRSGNPWFDESVVRAIQKASPLPPPPAAGDWPFEFTPPGRAG
jgi:TonB family protein